MILAAVNLVLSLYWLADALTTRTELHDDRLVIVSAFRRRGYRRGEIADAQRRPSAFALERVVIQRADGGGDHSPDVDPGAELAEAVRHWLRARA